MLIAFLAFFVVLGPLVIVHEVGHLLAAKKLNMKVQKFSIGFGPKIKSIRRGETEYVISAIPLGGFVQLSDEPGKEGFDSTSPHFSERPPLHKIIVCLAGPAMNFLLALILFTIIFMIGVSVPAAMNREVTVGWTRPGSPAMIGGLRPGDRVTKVNQTPISNWKELIEVIPLNINKQVPIEVIRDQKLVSMSITIGQRGEMGIHPVEIITIASVLKGSPAEASGLRFGDRIKSIDGKAVSSWKQFLYELDAAKSETISLEIGRGGQVYPVTVAPKTQTSKKMIGITFKPEEELEKYSFMQAVHQSLVKIVENIALTGITLWKLITLDMSIKLLGGPILIAQISGEAATSGMIPLLGLMAFLSIQLGIFNLLPFIPIVDGGQITLFLIELVKKRPLSPIMLEFLAKAGWLAMIVLIIVVSYNDIIRFF